ncbi:hypothetical protein, conserved [Entamoeba dispar SAW760]|uniref:Deoxynucleoside kinase domain-containing protein n=1 Tax=Entamoeba dispar (strain ATCC PRA-260 / SAW760) TaxID=370354 RepID=B0EH20_ENTDS|nr:uncharacterized protein EDI_192700 [Entamoeba dispar SAW760]EDR26169.1 hypothetical protein, conserved [Entamoeba dispar SAW760]|eukprot:EDR26169.1 hypothetical protein, conserved [Entamoeba dispar SAW760]
MNVNNSECINKCKTYTYKKQHIFISGSISVGKTMLCNLLFEYLDYYTPIAYIKEYIDYNNDGEFTLKHLHDSLISNFEFQNYVLDCYETQLNSSIYEDADIVIWDRHPIESLEVFCANNNSLSNEQRQKLKLRIEQLSRRYQIPQLTNKDVSVINIDTSRISTELIEEALVNTFIHPLLLGLSDGSIYVFLFCSDTNTQFKRLTKRNRTPEIELYKSKEDLNDLNNQYALFYTNLVRKKLNQTN